jgi:hypothetical protein
LKRAKQLANPQPSKIINGYFQEMSASLDQKILDYLTAHPDVAAWETGRALGFEKQQINSRLYEGLKGRVVQDNRYRWRLVGTDNVPQTEAVVTAWPDTPLFLSGRGDEVSTSD